MDVGAVCLGFLEFRVRGTGKIEERGRQERDGEEGRSEEADLVTASERFS